ncbi:thioesterase-like superfamily-domain-containing protein [Lipomyces tetrasporus]|uniref:Thioesterase-like superfamily-domain-containing protein n=1 Tax=Lipomyces tetrasporus TaxID=54092 RepID=A0AAD7QPN5_9ASCO|nr:thioesterase-like superfamily-domain-containing protein [Lipomyces tetrasporus]KAJ8098646.1 thioesterase-like superfamily-domain-containing protein [Lipomyces tetrasporus]
MTALFSDSDVSPVEKLLKLEQLDVDLYKSAEPLYMARGARGLYGGNVISQSLMAAIQTVPVEYTVHSMHCYFVLAGDPTLPVLYKVEHVRDGHSFVTRTVQARQRGRCIFTTTISFQIPAEAKLSHQPNYPGASLPQPDDLPDYAATAGELYKKGYVTKGELMSAEQLSSVVPMDTRIVLDEYPDGTPPDQKMNYLWVRAKGKIKNEQAHAMALAYISDNALLGTSARVNGVNAQDITMMVSLDHSIYFHAPFKADEWMLFQMNSPWTGSARGLVFGNIFTQDGILAASIIQEGVVRFGDLMAKPKPKL